MLCLPSLLGSIGVAMKCMSSCFSCLCGTKNSARVTPSDPLQIVQANSAKHHSHYRNTSGEDNNDGGRVNPNFTVGEGEDCSASLSDENTAVKALFIEVGKDRLLRVIHIRSLEDEPSPSRKGSVDGESNLDSKESPANPEKSENNGKSLAGQGGEGDDDEDEYWFSKWARKPRFRSIFSKNPENRPKLGGGGESNNNNGTSPEENSKVSVELEMARAAAAAKRRAWAYNNNGNCEPTITQQPTVSMGDEEEFSSIAIVNSSKQQWSKQQDMSDSNNKTPESSKNEKGDSSPVSPSKVKVEVHSDTSSSSLKEGISNPAFQGDEDEKNSDDDDEYDDCGYKKTEKPNTSKSSVSSSTSDKNTPVASASRSPSLNSSKKEEEDAITTEEPQIQNISPSTSSKTATPTSSQTDNIEPRKPLLFFIHSVAGSSDIWHRQYEFFQQLGYEIVAPDLLGHGLSSTPLNPKYYLFESLVQDLILIFDHFCKEDVKVVLIGHGYGACLAAMLARVRLKNVALLITIAGGGPTPLVRRTCCQDSWFAWKCKLFHSNRIRGRFDNPELKHVLPATIHENILSGQVWPEGDSAFYRRITVPTLLTYGMRDKVVTLVEECEMERTIPKSFLELIDSAGHMVMLDEPEKLNKMLCKFIQSWS